ncbi:MAG: hypothetical protein QGH39_09135, partial [Candidatus Thermoplasmatota archaeon]|nr:hypothetical protein [Candidatus Thermoplasmatota archaeon]
LLDFKKNAHWVLFSTIELAEMLMSRFDGIMKGTYIALDGQMSTGFTRLNDRLGKETQSIALSVKRANAEMDREMTKRLKQSSMRENKILSEVKGVRGEVDNVLLTMRDDILKASKGIIKATAREITNLRSNMEVETDEVSGRMEKVEENILNFLNTMDSDFSVTLKEKMSGVAKAIQVFNSELNKRAHNNMKVEEERFNHIDGKLEDLTLKSHVATRTLTDVVTKNLGDMKTEVGGRMDSFSKENKAILDKNAADLAAESHKTIDQVKDLTDIVQENYVDTSDLLKKQQKQLMDSLLKNQEEIKRNLDREISEVRSLIANIRGDIELIKTFLTKLHA